MIRNSNWIFDLKINIITYCGLKVNTSFHYFSFFVISHLSDFGHFSQCVIFEFALGLTLSGPGQAVLARQSDAFPTSCSSVSVMWKSVTKSVEDCGVCNRPESDRQCGCISLSISLLVGSVSKMVAVFGHVLVLLISSVRRWYRQFGRRVSARRSACAPNSTWMKGGIDIFPLFL